MARAPHLLRAAAAALAAGGAALLLLPGLAPSYGTIGGALGLDQRDVRVYDNFTDAKANDNGAPDARFPGYTGAELALWKAAVEWGSELHGDGQGDPHQPGGLGSGGANFDASWQGNASGIGGGNDNVHSEIAGSSGGVLAYCESPIADGWRIRFYSGWTWDDGPGTPALGDMDLQGVATHEYGHALGLGHSDVVGATMYASVNASGVAQRSLAPDDVAGVQAIYGAKSPTKPRITQALVDVSQGTLKLTGANFAASGNEVWFTRAAPSAPSAAPIVKVTGVASTSGGTSITVALPSGAGPGDVLVHVPGTSHASLSNAWPVDPASPGSPFQPPSITGVTPAYLPSVQNGPKILTLTGSGFLGLIEVALAGVPVDPARVDVHTDAWLELDVPPVAALGPVPIQLTSAFGASASATVTLVAPSPAALALASPILLSTDGIDASVGGAQGTVWVLAGSLLLSPSVLPGLLAADIGGQFQSLVLLGAGVLGPQGWAAVHVPLAGLPFGTPVHLQAATLDPAFPVPPYVMTNVATGTFYY